MGRSFKYHRPRGVIAAGSEEPNALVELREGGRQEPNTRATTVELFNGLVAKSQNRIGSLERDLMGVNDLFLKLPVGGFLLQNLHVAARLLGKDLRTHHPQCRRSWARCRSRMTLIFMTRASCIVICWSLARGLPVWRRH